MTRRRQLAAPAAPAEPCADVECLFCALHDHLGKADAFITTSEDQMERLRSGDEAEDLRRRSHVEHLVESAKLAVRAAAYTSRQIEKRVRRRQGA